MRVAVLLMAIGLFATGLFGASHKSTTKKPSGRSARHSSHGVRGAHSASHSRSHVHQARRNVQATPTPQRYREIQQALASRGYYKGPVDGTWNSDSVGALKRFQSDQNLAPDGKLTPLSLIAMGLGPKRTGGPPARTPPPGPAIQPPDSLSAPPATSVAPVTVQSNPTPGSQGPADAH